MFMNEFVHPRYQEEITLLDIASGQLDHLNLKHVVCIANRKKCTNEFMNEKLIIIYL